MTMITVRIDAKTKRRMSERGDVNWSDVVRKAIASKMDTDGKRNMGLAVLLNERNMIVPDEGYDSTRAIREWRQRVRRS